MGKDSTLKIFLEDSGTSSSVITPGEYRFKFRVMLPAAELFPRTNVWYLSLCSDRSCKTQMDIFVKVSFPLAGFSLLEQAPAALAYDNTGSTRRQSSYTELGA